LHVGHQVACWVWGTNTVEGAGCSTGDIECATA
jgi:hypothetical protein